MNIITCSMIRPFTITLHLKGKQPQKGLGLAIRDFQTIYVELSALIHRAIT